MDFTEIQLFFISGTKRGFFFYFCVKAVFQMQKNPLPDLSGQDGEAEAFAQVYREFAPKMRCFASKLLHDNLLTDDVVHNVFLRLWENREIMSKVESLDRYLFRAARNAIFDIYEHQKIVTKHEQNNAPGGGNAAMFSMDEQINAENLAMLIELAIDRMPPQRRRIFRMSRYLGYSNGEIASRLNLSINTVNNHIVLAIRELRQELNVLL